MFDSSLYHNNETEHEDRDAYFAREAQIKAELRQDLENEFQTGDHPSAEAMFSKAYEALEDDGTPTDVYMAYEVLAEEVMVAA